MHNDDDEHDDDDDDDDRDDVEDENVFTRCLYGCHLAVSCHDGAETATATAAAAVTATATARTKTTTRKKIFLCAAYRDSLLVAGTSQHGVNRHC